RADGDRERDRLAVDRAGRVVGGQADRGRNLHGRGRLGLAGRGLDVADIVRGDAVETVRVAVLPGEGGRYLRRGRLPERKGAFVGDVDVEVGDAGAARVVQTGPVHREARRAEGRQHT